MIVVIGGGVVGAAVAREAAKREPVIVASPTPRPHAGLWQRFGPGDTPPRAARVIVCAPVAADIVAGWTQQGPLTVVGQRVPGAISVLSSPCWDLHPRSLLPVIETMRRGGTGKLPAGLGFRYYLWAEDLARAVLAADHDLCVRGPASLDGHAIAAALAQRERGRCVVSWFGRVQVPDDPERDDWQEAWGTRRRLG